jgi:hypothetical protein
MSCAQGWAHRALEQLSLDPLEPALAERLRSHAAGCADCRTEYDRRTRTEAFLAHAQGGLSRARLDSLQAQLLARVAPPAEPAPPPARLFAHWRAGLAPLAVAAAALVLVVFLPRASGVDADGYQARGAADPHATFGVRAFCVLPGDSPQVLSEARAGGTLVCPPGSRLQFTATSPRAAQLELQALRAGAAPLPFVVAGDPDAQLREGVDVALPFSTPVDASWLSEPVQVRARFRDPATGQLLGESVLTLTP